MSAIRFQTTAKGNLLHLSYIFRKPEPLGAEDISRKQTRIQKNGGGQNIYSMDLIPRARILQPVF